MSTTANPSAKKNTRPNAVPTWITSGMVGLVVGGGATFLVMEFYFGYSTPAPPIMLGGPPPGMGGPGMGGMMRGGPGGGGAGGGGAGGGGAVAQAKRDLTSLVGKLDLLSQGVRVELSPEQSSELAGKLALLETADTMTSDDAQANLESLESILTDEQKAALASIELPRPPRAAGGGGPGMGGPGMGGPMGGGGPSMGMGGNPGAPAAPTDDNPFRQETNQMRLTELLTRLKGSSAETSPAAESQ